MRSQDLGTRKPTIGRKKAETQGYVCHAPFQQVRSQSLSGHQIKQTLLEAPRAQSIPECTLTWSPTITDHDITRAVSHWPYVAENPSVSVCCFKYLSSPMSVLPSRVTFLVAKCTWQERLNGRRILFRLFVRERMAHHGREGIVQFTAAGLCRWCPEHMISSLQIRRLG